MSHQVEVLESRTHLTVTIDSIAQQIYPANKTIIVPVNATSDSTGPVAYSVSTSDARIQARVLSNLSFLRLQVSIGGVDRGAMEFALFGDIAPKTVARITELVNSGFYDNLTFHRVIPGFMAQGGDPLGTGSGGSGVKFEDEFHPEAIFATKGQLAMANSGADTNDSQFFITDAETHHLNFVHTIFGQMITGAGVLQAIMAVPTTGEPTKPTDPPANKPTVPVVITDASIVQNNADTIVLVKGPLNVPGSVTVTATDHNSTASQTFSVNGQTELDANLKPVNDPAFLLPMADLQTVSGFPVTFRIQTFDIDGGTPFVDAITLDAQKLQVSRTGDTVTVTPVGDFSGTAEILVGSSRGTSWDTERLTVTVLPAPFAQYNATTRVLTVNATSMSDTVTLTTEGDLLRATLNGTSLTFGLVHIGSVSVNLGDGDDSLTTGAGVPAISVLAGAGNDYVFGSDRDDSIRGGTGNDTLYGAGGNDSIGGGDGHDLIGGQAGWDTFSGGLGRDTIRGGDNGDLISGGNGADLLAGGRGLDTLYGEANNDSLDGQDGADSLYGGDGDDTLVTGFGVDQAFGNAGRDVFYTADDVPDQVFGGLDEDTAYVDLLDVAAAENVIND